MALKEKPNGTTPGELVIVHERGQYQNDKDWLAQLKELIPLTLDLPQISIQIRDKRIDVSQKDKLQLTLEAKKLVLHRRPDKYPNIAFNLSLREASELGISTVHLSEKNLMQTKEKQALKTKLLSASIHSLQSAHHANRIGVEYVIYGPIYTPASAPKRATGIESLRKLTKLSPLPVIAIGGMKPDRIPEILDAGARGIGAITLFTQTDRVAALANV